VHRSVRFAGTELAKTAPALPDPPVGPPQPQADPAAADTEAPTPPIQDGAQGEAIPDKGAAARSSKGGRGRQAT